LVIGLNLVDRPPHINEQHWHELTVESAIASLIATLNFASVEPNPKPYNDRNPSIGPELLLNHLMVRDGNQYPSTKTLRWWLNALEKPFASGGLWCQGTGKWGQFKAVQPRIDQHGDPVKYESPPKMPMGVYLMRPRNWNATRMDTSTRLAICEGAKKTAALESKGIATIGLSGANGGAIKETGILALRSQIRQFNLQKRKVVIIKDHDPIWKVNTVCEVDKAWLRLGALLVQAGAQVAIAAIPVPPESKKVGIDDYLAQGGQLKDLQVRTYSQWAKTRPLELKELYKRRVVKRRRGPIEMPVKRGQQGKGMKVG
jgi:hypothetical protein